MRKGLLIGAFVFLGWTATSAATEPKSNPVPAQPAAEEPASFYTLQVQPEGDLAVLEKTADYFTGLTSLRTRIVKEEGSYVIRIGKSLQSGELEAYIPTLESAGFLTATLLYIPDGQEEVTKVISPELPEFVSHSQPQHQPYLLQARQEDSPAAARRMSELFPTEISLSRMRRLKEAMDKEAPEESAALIQRAWEAFRHGSIVSACELFENAQTLPGVEQEALRGLAHCFLRMGNYEESIALLTWFIKQGVKPEEAHTLLVEALFKAGKLDAAQEEANLLEEAQARQWRALISTTKKENELARIKKLYDPKNPEAFVKMHQTYMEQCLLPDTFLTATKDLMSAKSEAAAHLLEQLLDACNGHWNIKLSAYIGLMQILPPEIMRARIHQELERRNLPSDYRKKLLASAAKPGPSDSKIGHALDKSKNAAKQ